MNKAELINAAAEKAGLSKKDTEAAVNAAIDVISQCLAEGDKVQLVGFGAFEVKSRAERIGRNPKTKESIKIPASKVPVFKPGRCQVSRFCNDTGAAANTRRPRGFGGIMRLDKWLKVSRLIKRRTPQNQGFCGGPGFHPGRRK